jgi:GR25 family glycosyltransferase involved in LPS biosynthesis
MKTFVINMESRKDRRDSITKTFDDVDFKNYSFYSGIDGTVIKGTEDIYNLFYGNDFNWRQGFIGAALSHYNLWQQLIKDNDTSYCIFEDDIVIESTFVEQMSFCEEFIQDRKADILFLGYSMLRHNIIESKSDTFEIIEFQKDLYVGGCFAYIISSAGAKKLIDYINYNGIYQSIDFLMATNRSLMIYECSPQIVFSDWLDSNRPLDSDVYKNYKSFDFPFPKYQVVNIENNKYKYYPGCDCHGNDIRYVGKQSVVSLSRLVENNKNCVAFNTLGYLKSKAEQTNSINGSNEGVYVKIPKKYESKIRVKMISAECSSYDFCNELNSQTQGNYTWNDIQITGDNNADYYVIMKGVFENEFYIPEKTIFFSSGNIRNNNFLRVINRNFDRIFEQIEDTIYEDINIFPKDVKINKICFLHSCTLINTGTYILDELYDEIKKSGLLNELDYLIVNNIGIKLDKNHFKNDKVKVINHSEESNLFEIPTLFKVLKFSKIHPDCKLLYLHTKGISRNSQNVTEWTKYLTYFMVTKYKDCLLHLDNYDAVGCNYTLIPYVHFSGNFWWANTNYIKTIDSILMEKYDAEWWILSNTRNFFSMHNSNIDHYHVPYPPEKYVS